MSKRRSDVYRCRKSNRWATLAKKMRSIYGDTCMKCGTVEASPHVDHIIPASRGLSRFFDMYNLQILCPTCNLDKSDSNCNDYRKPTDIAKLDDFIRNYDRKQTRVKEKQYPEDIESIVAKIITRLTKEELVEFSGKFQSKEKYYRRIYDKYKIILGL